MSISRAKGLKHINPLKNKLKEKMGGRGLIYVGQNMNKWRALANAKPSGFMKTCNLTCCAFILCVAKTGWS